MKLITNWWWSVLVCSCIKKRHLFVPSCPGDTEICQGSKARCLSCEKNIFGKFTLFETYFQRELADAPCIFTMTKDQVLKISTKSRLAPAGVWQCGKEDNGDSFQKSLASWSSFHQAAILLKLYSNTSCYFIYWTR